MVSDRSRRQLLATGAAVALGVIAGCSGGPESGTTVTAGAGELTQPGDGGDGGVTTAGDGGGDDGGEATLGDALQPADSFAMEIRTGSGDDQRTITGRFADGNSYQRFDAEEGEIEIYIVDGDTYMVSGGSCFLNPGRGAPSNEADPAQYQSDESEAFPEVTAAGRETISGVETYVFEVSADRASGSEPVTYYVSVGSGRLRRIESGQTVIDYDSYGAVDPVQPPDMDCRSMPSR